LAAGYDLWLNNTGYIDRQIIAKGEFEPASTRAIKRFVKEGDVVIDVGANIGYYTVLMSRLAGASGKVIAFEPTRHFGGVLAENIAVNKLGNVEVVSSGLSNRAQEMLIDIGPSSATLHSPAGFDAILGHEEITLTTLNDFVKQRAPEKIDFIKVDIDGHEPLFFDGAWDALEKYSPIIIFEVSHLHYLEAGVAAWDFYDLVRSKGYKFYHEDDFAEIKSKENFLRRCANFAYSSNVLITKQALI
jgi:FkbM family methyltransferase